MQKPLAAVMTLILLASGCSGSPDQPLQPGAVSQLAGAVRIDGSSTVFPISEAVAEEFQKQQSQVRVTVGIAGTGGGFKRFLDGETDINDASRPIAAAEVEAASQSGLQFVELPIAYDGLSILVNPQNDFVGALTVADLKRMWEPGSRVRRWSDLKAGWPPREIHFYGPGTDSGTFDYFTEAINGKAKAMRADFSASEDDNVLVQGIAGDADAIGFFGYAYYFSNKEKLKLVAVDGGSGPVSPTPETIRNGSYAPLSRPVFIYVAQKAAERPEVKAFVDFYLTEGASLAGEVGYIPLPDSIQMLVKQRWEARRTGSVFHGQAHETSLSLEALLQASK